jgi:hypothetical protein
MEASDFLEHHGVKGMKWGHRKREDAISDLSRAVANRVADRGDRILAKNKGSNKRVVGKAVGKTAGYGALGLVATHYALDATGLISDRKTRFVVRNGIRVVAALGAAGYLTKNAADVTSTAIAKRRRETS